MIINTRFSSKRRSPEERARQQEQLRRNVVAAITDISSEQTFSVTQIRKLTGSLATQDKDIKVILITMAAAGELNVKFKTQKTEPFSRELTATTLQQLQQGSMYVVWQKA